MTQEDKQLLLKDLCARLPYSVKVDVDFYYATKELSCDLIQDLFLDEKSLRPYLRPMSTMTEEEKEEIAFIRDRDFQSVRKWVHDESIKETGNICPISCGEIDYCNKKHLDYRGLIKKGLALEAPEGMYK